MICTLYSEIQCVCVCVVTFHIFLEKKTVEKRHSVTRINTGYTLLFFLQKRCPSAWINTGYLIFVCLLCKKAVGQHGVAPVSSSIVDKRNIIFGKRVNSIKTENA